MICNDFKGKKLSALGMGCMRLPLCSDNDKEIDICATKEMLAYAMKNGINYYDTAWGYHNGKSETVMGELLKEYPRNSFYLATKFPGYSLNNMTKIEEIFEKQLEKCQVDYFDFYLFHTVSEKNIDAYLDEKYGLFNYLIKQKEAGSIHHLGFSAHGNLNTIKRFLDAYGKDIEFCQLQINWLDWEYQNAKAKVELVSSYGIPVWVMEPVRGGKLVNLEEKYEKRLNAARPNISNAEWAFRFIQSIPEVKMTLSGMSNFEQVKQNIETFKDYKPTNEQEREMLFRIGRAMTNENAIPCTACKYCVDYCVKGLNIPWLIELYNEHTYTNGSFVTPKALESISSDKLPSACVACRACENVCPQNIKISEMMADFAKKIAD